MFAISVIRIINLTKQSQITTAKRVIIRGHDMSGVDSYNPDPETTILIF